MMKMDLQIDLSNKIDAYKNHRIIADKQFLDDEQLDDAHAMQLLCLFSPKIREREYNLIRDHFVPMFARGHPYSLFIYGATGSGKTLATRIFFNVLMEECRLKSVECKVIRLHLKTPKTPFQFLNELACQVGVSKPYKKGIPHEDFMGKVVDKFKEYTGYLVLLVDEINNLKGETNPIFQFLIRRLPTDIQAKLILVFISNKYDWTDFHLDTRCKSFLKKNDIFFHPYNAYDLQKILKLRVTRALEFDKVASGVVEKIAAYSSREHGDARRAIALLAKSAEIAEARQSNLDLECVDSAERAIDMDGYLDAAQAFAPQVQLAFLSVCNASTDNSEALSTGKCYESYKKLAAHCGYNPIMPRRFSDHLRELDMMGFINWKVYLKARAGKCTEITLPIDGELKAKLSERMELSLGLR